MAFSSLNSIQTFLFYVKTQVSSGLSYIYKYPNLDSSMVLYYPLDDISANKLSNYGSSVSNIATYDASFVGTGIITTTNNTFITGLGDLSLNNTMGGTATNYVIVDNSFTLNSSQGLSISFWFSTTGVVNTKGALIYLPFETYTNSDSSVKRIELDISGTNMIYSGIYSTPFPIILIPFTSITNTNQGTLSDVVFPSTNSTSYVLSPNGLKKAYNISGNNSNPFNNFGSLMNFTVSWWEQNPGSENHTIIYLANGSNRLLGTNDVYTNNNFSVDNNFNSSGAISSSKLTDNTYTYYTYTTTPNSWVHYTIKCTNTNGVSTVRLFINGIYVATNTFTNFINGFDNFKYFAEDSRDYFYLYNLRVYDSVITDSLVLSTYNSDLSIDSTCIMDSLSFAAKTAMFSSGKQAGAYGVRLLYSGYSGPVLKIKAGSSGTPTDFYADVSGNLTTSDGISLTTVLGGQIAYITIWYDQTGHSNNGTAVNTPIYDTVNKTVDFTSGYFSVPNNAFPTGNSAYTYIYIPANYTDTANQVIHSADGLQGSNFLTACTTFLNYQYTASIYNSWWGDGYNDNTYMSRKGTKIAECYNGTTNNNKSFYFDNKLYTNTFFTGVGGGTNTFSARNQNSNNNYIGHTTQNTGINYTGTLEFFYWAPIQLSVSDLTILCNSGLTTTTSFSPLSISGVSLNLWLDANDSTTFTNSGGTGAVTGTVAWNDKSGLSNNMNSSNSSNGSYLTNFTYRPVVLLPYSSSNYLINSTVNIQTFPMTLFIVLCCTTDTTRGYNHLFTGYSFDTQFYGIHLSIDSFRGLTVTRIYTTEAEYTQNTLPNSGTSLYLYTIQLNGTGASTSNLLINLNGTLLIDRSFVTTYGTTKGPMMNSSAGNIYIAEEVYYQSLLNSTQIKQMEGYLAWKWGLQSSLPSSHTYSTTNTIKGP